MLKSTIAVFTLFLLGIVSLPDYAAASEAAGGTLLYSYPSNAGPLNPHMYSPNQMYAQEMIYEPLVSLGSDGLIHPCLAEKWEISDDGLTYTFHLRPGVVFSDGTPFDAEAVVENFRHIMANRKRHAWLDLSNRIADFQAVDTLTFKLILNTPYHPTLEDLSLPRPFRFLSPAAFPNTGITRDGIKKPVGTGPWKLKETRLGEYDLFERNELYWGDKATPDFVKALVIPDPISRAMALETGETDLVMGHGMITYDTFNAFRNNPAYETWISDPVGCVALAINSNRAPTDDLRVRQALQHLCDKDILVSGVFLGAHPRADTLFSPDVPYCDIGLIPYEYDTTKAAKLLDEAGWTLAAGDRFRKRGGRELAVDLCFIGNDAGHKALAEVLQGQGAAVGVRFNLVGEEEDSFLRRQKDGNFGMIVNPTWGPPFEPHAMLGSMRQPSHADYQAQSGLPMKEQLDRDITRVLETTDEAERAALYRSILTTLHEQAVYLPLHYGTLLAVYKKGTLVNFHFGPGKSKFPFEDYMKER